MPRLPARVPAVFLRCRQDRRAGRQAAAQAEMVKVKVKVTGEGLVLYFGERIRSDQIRSDQISTRRGEARGCFEHV